MRYQKPAYGDTDWHTPVNANTNSLDAQIGTQHNTGGAHNTITGDAIIISSDNDLIALQDITHVSGDSATTGNRCWSVGTATSHDAFVVYYNTEVSQDVCIKIGQAYLWIVDGDPAPKLRILDSLPTSGDDGQLVGGQS
jgi:hypothetical protein